MHVVPGAFNRADRALPQTSTSLLRNCTSCAATTIGRADTVVCACPMSAFAS
eukprot:CAMPEP_0185205016 /NCGR_PEP_ID=MMETSP1140-20130426/55901_1 /TAXON_ID=298111 /ORGANISM="Pavlova sp., Strain CCMP459" /LENGTH=51 /DNA_ID=CAMNT_0027772597 /DNA_START=1 /DNA_END=153 /DNA_ORIENTATION=-